MTPKKDEAPPPKEPPAFGSGSNEKGLATGLGIAQPTATDQPEPPASRPKP